MNSGSIKNIITFLKYEMQTASVKIWTHVSVSICDDDICFTAIFNNWDFECKIFGFKVLKIKQNKTK